MKTLEEQADHLLGIFKEHQSTLYLDNIKKKVNESKIVIEGSVLNMLLEKLHRDKLIYQDPTTSMQCYSISFEGNQFIGYVNKKPLDEAALFRKNLRDWVLSWGTLLAGIGGLGLLIYQLLSSCHK